MDWDDLSGWRPRIELELALQYQVERRRAPPALRAELDRLAEYTLRGGKRFRALLVLAGFYLATGGQPTRALRAAAALEHFQSWMLIHDDIIDHAEQRRGGPALHRALSEWHRSSGLQGSPDDYGTGAGVTLGDLQETFTVEALLRSPVGSARSLAALAEYVRMTRFTAYGQLLDIRNSITPIPRVTEKDILLVHRLKSAEYTVCGPLRIGASLGGGRRPLMRLLDSVGTDLGVGFQLRDDVIGAGLGGPEPEKSANDIAEGKRTLLILRAWETGTEASRALLTSVVGNRDAALEQVLKAQSLIRDGGGLAYSEERIRDLGEKAFRTIDRSPALPRARKALLRDLGQKLLWREK